MHIHSLNIGMPKNIEDSNGKLFLSAIQKTPTLKSISLGKYGFQDDKPEEKAHGGIDKAVHMFSYEHYSFFEKRAEKKLEIPVFGENITICAYDETIARVGDLLQIGNAILQVSEPTIRCYKIGQAAQLPLMLKWIHEDLKTGFYLRVLEPGEISKDSQVKLLEQGSEEGQIATLNHAMFIQDKNDKNIESILRIPTLSQGWKDRLSKN